MRRNMQIIKGEWWKENKHWAANTNDKISVNLAYETYLDYLCKDGVITQKQWQNATLIYTFNYDTNKWRRTF